MFKAQVSKIWTMNTSLPISVNNEQVHQKTQSYQQTNEHEQPKSHFLTNEHAKMNNFQIKNSPKWMFFKKMIKPLFLALSRSCNCYRLSLATIFEVFVLKMVFLKEWENVDSRFKSLIFSLTCSNLFILYFWWTNEQTRTNEHEHEHAYLL